MSFGYEDIKAAYDRIKPYIRRTPLETSMHLSTEEKKYSFKLEPFQTVKSFKIRGAMSKMTTLTEEERQRGVATISSGNHGAVALAAVIDKPERVGGSNIAMVVSGGNIDSELFCSLLVEFKDRV